MNFGTPITILYKNGQKVHLRVKSFTVQRSELTGALTVEWDTARLSKKPLLIGVEDIMAVYQGKV